MCFKMLAVCVLSFSHPWKLHHRSSFWLTRKCHLDYKWKLLFSKDLLYTIWHNTQGSLRHWQNSHPQAYRGSRWFGKMMQFMLCKRQIYLYMYIATSHVEIVQRVWRVFHLAHHHSLFHYQSCFADQGSLACPSIPSTLTTTAPEGKLRFQYGQTVAVAISDTLVRYLEILRKVPQEAIWRLCNSVM